MPLQIVIIYPSFNTMNFKNIVTSAAIVSVALTASIGSSFITPAPAQAATAQDFVNLFDFLKRYVTDLDKMTNPAPAIPAVTQPDIPETEPAEPETTEEAESN
jgi:hypothetical protein